MKALNPVQLKKKVNQSVYGLLALIVMLVLVFYLIFNLQHNKINTSDDISINYHLYISEQILKMSRSINNSRLFYLSHYLEYNDRKNNIKNRPGIGVLIMDHPLRDKINALRYETNKLAKTIDLAQMKYALTEFNVITQIFNKSRAAFDAALVKLTKKKYVSYQELSSIIAPLNAVSDQLNRLHVQAHKKLNLLTEADKKNNFQELMGLIVVLFLVGVTGVFRMLNLINNTLRKLTQAQDQVVNLNEKLEKRVELRTKELEETLLLLTEENEQRKFAEEKSNKANLAKSDFLSQMSHELRTPMNAILGFAQLLELDDQYLSELQNENVKEILNAGSHLLTLINQVLDLSKIESGKMDILFENISIDKVLKQSISLMQTLVEERKLELIDNVSGRGFVVKADMTHLKQVLLNLLSNAVKYNSDSGTIILDGRITNDNNLRISVSDKGKGLSDNDIMNLFKPFERLNNKENIEGTGIGLVISKHLIELMDGSIGVESAVGEGSTFWIELEMSVL